MANLGIQSLCLVDLLYSCIGVPFVIFLYNRDTVKEGLVDQTVFDPLWCIPNFFFSCSLHHIGLITLDRFISITRPLEYTVSSINRRRFVVCFIGCIWVINSFWCFGTTISFQCFCNDSYRKIVFIVCQAVFWLLPICIIIAMYLLMGYEVFIKKPFDGRVGGAQGVQLRGAVTTFWIVLALIVSSLPHSLYYFIHLVYDGHMVGLSSSTQRIISVLLQFLKVSNCFINPVIYSLRMKSIRTTLISTLRPRRNVNIYFIS